MNEQSKIKQFMINNLAQSVDNQGAWVPGTCGLRLLSLNFKGSYSENQAKATLANVRTWLSSLQTARLSLSKHANRRLCDGQQSHYLRNCIIVVERGEGGLLHAHILTWEQKGSPLFDTASPEWKQLRVVASRVMPECTHVHLGYDGKYWQGLCDYLTVNNLGKPLVPALSAIKAFFKATGYVPGELQIGGRPPSPKKVHRIAQFLTVKTTGSDLLEALDSVVSKGAGDMYHKVDSNGDRGAVIITSNLARRTRTNREVVLEYLDLRDEHYLSTGELLASDDTGFRALYDKGGKLGSMLAKVYTAKEMEHNHVPTFTFNPQRYDDSSGFFRFIYLQRNRPCLSGLKGLIERVDSQLFESTYNMGQTLSLGRDCLWVNGKFDYTYNR